MAPVIKAADLVYLRLPSREAVTGGFVAKRLGKPLFAEFHGDGEEAAYISLRSKGIPKALARLLSMRFRNRLARVANLADVVYVVGRSLKLKYAAGHPRVYETTNNAVRLENIYERIDSWASGPVRILFVGEIAPRKGLEHLVEALRICREWGLETELKLIGDGAPAYCRLLQRQADCAGVGQRILWSGHKTFGVELLNEYRAASLFVLPSIGSEGVPRVIAEANASGCPVVATAVGSVPYMMEAGKFGRVVRPGDPLVLAEAIKEIVTDADFRRACIRRGYVYVKTKCYESQEQQIGEYLRDHFTEYVTSGASHSKCNP